MARNYFSGMSTNGASVTVTYSGTAIKPVIYGSATAAAISNPITANGDGSYAFWVDDGHYKIANGAVQNGVAVDLDRRILTTNPSRAIVEAADIQITPSFGIAANNLQSYLEMLALNPAFLMRDDGAATHTFPSANGALFTISAMSESITLSTVALTTDSTANLLPANSIILGVTALQTTAITTSTNWGLSDPTTANRFAAATAIATPSLVGLVHWSGASTTLAAGPSQAAAAKLRITVTVSNPGAGVVRATVWALTFGAPTS